MSDFTSLPLFSSLSKPPDFSDSIRRQMHDGQIMLSLVDIMAEFSDLETRPDVLWKRTKKRLIKDGFQYDPNVIKLKLMAADGKKYATDCANVQTCLRIVQSIPAAKAESIRQWLATLAVERIEETIDPELGEIRARERTHAVYERLGRNEQWIGTREFNITSRKGFTAAVSAYIRNPHYGIITNDVYQGVLHDDAMGLRQRLGLHGSQNPRDYFSIVALNYIGIAEAVCAIKLAGIAENEPVPLSIARDIIIAVSMQIGAQADQMATALGIDILTGTNLLKGEN